MKKNYIFFLLTILVFQVSCSDFLDQKPKSQKSKEDFFTSVDDAQAAVNILYRNGFPDLYRVQGPFVGSNMMLGSYLSGFYDNEYKGQSVFVQYLQTLTYTSVNISEKVEDVWFSCYQAISRANYIIKYIDNVPDISEAENKRLLAQALFFRAASYFFLVRFFGDVPLITEPYESMSDIYISRSSVKNVYDLIVSDLNIALLEGLSDRAFADNGFRITKGTVAMLLADVYLHMSGFPLREDNYAKAANAARIIIQAGKHTLTSNGETPEQSAYNKIRTSDNLTEYIYSLEFDAQITANANMVKMSLPSIATSWGIVKATPVINASQPLPEIINFFDHTNDLRIQEKQYIHTSYSWDSNGETIVKTFDVTPHFFFDEEALFSTGLSSKDIPIYRYAETLLIAAEAIAESEGVTDEAVNYLAQVRSRAYTKQTLSDISNNLKNLSKEAFVREVWSERAREFLFENRIWTDIQRTRKYPIASENQPGIINYVDVIGATNPWGATYAEKHLLFPIPYYEKQRNPSLEQNPGYE